MASRTPLGLNRVRQQACKYDGKLTFNVDNAALVLNFCGSSDDLINAENLIGESANISDITPITYGQGKYQNTYGENDSLKGGV